MRAWARVLSSLLDLLAPPGCAACDQPTSGVFCGDCAPSALASPEAVFDRVPLVVAGAYEPPLSDAIIRFKYGGRADLSKRLSTMLYTRVARLGLPRETLLVPVPLHARRLAERGYNQAALLARDLSLAVALPDAPRLLLRRRETERQVGNSRERRLTNANGAFDLNARALAGLRGQRPAVVLVDDVITTGSTVRACAQVLARGGMRLAAVVAVARAGARPSRSDC